jgi:hypothetical protein
MEVDKTISGEEKAQGSLMGRPAERAAADLGGDQFVRLQALDDSHEHVVIYV